MTSDASKLPLVLQSVQPQLSSGYGIEIRALPTDTKPAVSHSAAVATALERFGQSPYAGVSAFAVAATAASYGDVEPDGTLKLRISDRQAWLVLIPNMEIPHRGRADPPSYTAPLAVFLDATTGEYLMAATV